MSAPPNLENNEIEPLNFCNQDFTIILLKNLILTHV